MVYWLIVDWGPVPTKRGLSRQSQDLLRCKRGVAADVLISTANN